MLGPPYRRLLRSAGVTEDLFVTRELHQKPPPRIPTGPLQEETTPILKRLWYDWTQQQPGIEPTNPLGQYSVPPIVAFYDQQGLLRTYSLPEGSIHRAVCGISLTSGRLVSELFPVCLFVLFVCGISLTSGQLVSELFPDCTRSCFPQVVSRRRGGDRIYEMRCLFVAVGPNARFIVLPHWDNMS